MKALKSVLKGLILSLILAFSLVSCSSKDITREMKLEHNFENMDFRKDGIGELEIYKFEDGDTLFFGTKDDYFKVRFLGNDTPETVGVLEPFGKAASNFTYEKLRDAKKIVVESTVVGEKAEYDNYMRYLGLIWYIPANEEEFVNLNLEIVRAGYSKYIAIPEKPEYDSYFKRAADEAKKEELGLWSSNDPDFPTEITNVTIKDLSLNFDSYDNKKVKFTGYVTKLYHETDDTGDSIIVEDIVDGIKYQVKIYKHTRDHEIYAVGNKTTFVGFATNFHGLKRITGISLPNPYQESSKIEQKGYYLQFGIDTGAKEDKLSHIYSEIVVKDVIYNDGVSTITGSATRFDNNVNVTLKVNGNIGKDCVNKKISVSGYSKNAVTNKTQDISLDVLSIDDIQIKQ